MADPARYRYMDPAGRRSPPLYNPARASMPVSAGAYNSLYTGDAHAMSASHHDGVASRPAEEYRTSAVPISSTAYAVRKEPISRSTSVSNGSRVHRTMEPSGSSKRPIIVTTKHNPASPRAGSPSRESYRSSDDGHYYALPASSIPRGRASAYVPFSATMDDEEYRRLRERTQYDWLSHRGGDPHRSSRQFPLYAGSYHRTNTLDFGDEWYEYTKPSDLARYDLDHDRPRRARRESLDRYYRPTVSIPTADLARPYDSGERRARGPPPTTWGLDKLSRAAAAGIYDGAGTRMPMTAAVPPAEDARRAGLLEGPRAEARLPLLQDRPGRSGHHDDYYYDDDLSSRDLRGRDHDYFQDDDVAARGYGIRVDSDGFDDHHLPPETLYHDDRLDYRDDRRGYSDRLRRGRSDDDLDVVRHEYEDRDRRRHRDRDYGLDDGDVVVRDRKDARASDNEPDGKREKLRDKVSAGLGLAAASLGLGSAVQGKDGEGREDRSPSRRQREEDANGRKPEADSRTRASRKEPMLGDEEFEIVEHPRDREKSRNGTVAEPSTAPKRDGDAVASSSRDNSSSTDERKTKSRRRPRASSFNPNDTAELAEMRARLAALAVDKADPEEKDRSAGKDTASAKETSAEPEASKPEKRDADADADADASALVRKEDEKDGQDPSASPRDERQVRVVPPPKEPAPEKKPIKGILKQPRARFPEEPNPIREGVAPHKDDKSKANVPPGARWTKISRRMVNPEALRIGKERFEVRDDFVIVLRVLSREEIQAYAAATAAIRGRFCCAFSHLASSPDPTLLSFCFRAPCMMS